MSNQVTVTYRGRRTRIRVSPSLAATAVIACACEAAGLPPSACGRASLVSTRPSVVISSADGDTPYRLLGLGAQASVVLELAPGTEAPVTMDVAGEPACQSSPPAAPGKSAPPAPPVELGAFGPALAHLHAERESPATLAAATLAHRVIDNAVVHADAKYRSIPTASKAFVGKLAPSLGACEFLAAAGFAPTPDGSRLVLPDSVPDAVLRRGRNLLAAFVRGLADGGEAGESGGAPAQPVTPVLLAPSVRRGKEEAEEAGGDDDDDNVVPMETEPALPTAAFVATTTTMAGSSRGDEMADIRALHQLADEQWQAKVAAASCPIDRMLGVWPPGVAPPPPPAVAVPELSSDAALVASAAADLAQRVRDLVDGPFRTKALIAKEQQANAMKHERTTLRIAMPDGATLQACFAPLETLAAVHATVAAALEEPATAFDLVVTPPRTVLDPADPRSLFALGLVPGARVMCTAGTLAPAVVDIGPPPTPSPPASPAAPAPAPPSAPSASSSSSSSKKKKGGKPSWLRL